MGTYLFSSEVLAKVYKKLYDSDIEDLMMGAKRYTDINGKTIDEVLELLYEVKESKEDRIGGIYRHLKYTQGKVRLKEDAENELAEDRYLSLLIDKVERLKAWLNENNH